MRTPFLAAAAAAGALAFAAPAAAAPGFSLSLSGPSAGVVGQAMLIQVAGKNPPLEEYWFPSWLEVATIDGGVMAACPPYYQDAVQLAVATGGEWLAFAQREHVQADGSFAATLGYTPKRAGRWLLCGYTEDGATNTLAAAAMIVNVAAVAPPTGGAPAPAPGPAAAAPPVNSVKPRVTRTKRTLVCDPGRWAGATGSYRYRWSVGGRRKRGADGRRLAITRGLRGRTVTCTVTASNTAGATTAVSRPRRVS